MVPLVHLGHFSLKFLRRWRDNTFIFNLNSSSTLAITTRSILEDEICLNDGLGEAQLTDHLSADMDGVDRRMNDSNIYDENAGPRVAMFVT